MYAWTVEETENARLAFMRFGLGPTPNWQKRWEEKGWVGLDGARNALLAEIERGPETIDQAEIRVPVNTPDGPLAAYSYAQMCNFGMNIKNAPPAAAKPGAPKDSTGVHSYIHPVPWDFEAAERAVRLQKYLRPEVGFVERLVLFWVNHFSVYSPKSRLIMATAGHLEREVIRKHVLGNFSDMLKGVIQHPAMIAYLDNNMSAGPTSAKAKKYGRSVTYNENLAREILELHTLGPFKGFERDGPENYSQADVTNLSKIITGWGFYPAKSPNAGQFSFSPEEKEPGAFEVIGTLYDQTGIEQGLAVLDDLAWHEETAKHISIKLLRHFVTDDPSREQVEILMAAFNTKENNLKAVAQALVNMDYAWKTPAPGIRRPYEWLISIVRATNLPGHRPARVAQSAILDIGRNLNNHIWDHMTPDGFSDFSYVWEIEDAIRIRKDAAAMYLGSGGIWKDNRWKKGTNPATGQPYQNLRPSVFAQRLLPGILSPATLSAITKLDGNILQALSLLFISPEYMRR